MLKDLIIIGASGCGREVLQWAKDINKAKPTWNIKGFLDDNLDALKNKKTDAVVLSTIDGYQLCENDVFTCAMGNGANRKAIIEKLKARGAKFVNIIHPTAIVAETAMFGDAVILYPNSLISANAELGDGVMVNMYSSIAHDCVVGDYCTISAHCDVTGACSLGCNVFMGTTSNLIPGVRIGDNAYVCAGSTVMSFVRQGRRVMGNPAKIINL